MDRTAAKTRSWNDMFHVLPLLTGLHSAYHESNGPPDLTMWLEEKRQNRIEEAPKEQSHNILNKAMGCTGGRGSA